MSYTSLSRFSGCYCILLSSSSIANLAKYDLLLELRPTRDLGKLNFMRLHGVWRSWLCGSNNTSLELKRPITNRLFETCRYNLHALQYSEPHKVEFICLNTLTHPIYIVGLGHYKMVHLVKRLLSGSRMVSSIHSCQTSFYWDEPIPLSLFSGPAIKQEIWI